MSNDMDKKCAVEITSKENVVIVTFKAASITNTTEIETISKQMSKFIEENHPDKIVVDFEGVKFFSSQVLGMLLNIRAKLKSNEGEIVVSAINPQLYRVFKITNLDKIFRFFPDKKSAVKAINAN